MDICPAILCTIKKKRVGRKKAKKKVKHMKTIVFVGNHKNFSGLRLGTRLAHVLAEKGQDTVLAGIKGKLPKHTKLATLEFAAAAKAKSMAETFKKAGADRVISLVSLPACEAAALAGLPYIYCEPENFKEEKAVKNKKALLKKAEKVVVIGKGDKTLDKKLYASNAVRTANPAVWVEHYNYDKPACFKKENNIVAAGKLAKSGGFDVLLKTWARLAPAHGTWHLTIVGDGVNKAALKKFIEKNGLSESTEIVPADSDLYSLLRNADIYVSPAREAEGLDELLDAMASKLPVVATDVAGADELVANAVSGLLVNAGEEEPLTVALDDLMVNWGKRVGMAIEASHMKDRFPFDAFAALFDEE